MRNVFDQYSQPENRVTHALTTALHEDPALLRAFLVDIARCAPPGNAGPLAVFAQTAPGEPEPPEQDDDTGRGIPDAWITGGEDWCLLIENKVTATPDRDQLLRHLATAKRRGYASPNALLVTILPPPADLPGQVRVVYWRDVYRWLVARTPGSDWAGRVVAYLEQLEGQMIDQGRLTTGTLTAFNGFRFDRESPFSWLQGKRALGLATEALRQRADLRSGIGMDPDLLGRPAITGRNEDVVWDFLQFGAARDAAKFTDFTHLTPGVRRDRVEAMVTVPNGLPRAALRRLIDLGPAGFHALVGEILERFKPVLAGCVGMEPRMRAVQRRFRTRRSPADYDAVLNFDLRTAFPGSRPPKFQPEWLAATYDCLADKQSNFQFQIGAHFPWRTCAVTATPEILDHMAAAWIACGPLIDMPTRERMPGGGPGMPAVWIEDHGERGTVCDVEVHVEEAGAIHRETPPRRRRHRRSRDATRYPASSAAARRRTALFDRRGGPAPCPRR